MVNNIAGTRSFMSSSTETVTLSGGVPNVILYDTNGNEIASSRVLDPNGINFTNGGTIDQLASSMQTWIQAQDPQLVNATVAVNADGHFNVNLGTDTIGIAFRDQQSAIKGSAQTDTTASVDLDGDGTADKTYQGFSNFLGLNDFFTSQPDLSQWTSGFQPANYTLGIPSAGDAAVSPIPPIRPASPAAPSPSIPTTRSRISPTRSTPTPRLPGPHDRLGRARGQRQAPADHTRSRASKSP